MGTRHHSTKRRGSGDSTSLERSFESQVADDIASCRVTNTSHRGHNCNTCGAVTTAAAALLLVGGADAVLLAARWIRDADFVHGPAVFDPDPGKRVHDGLLRS